MGCGMEIYGLYIMQAGRIGRSHCKVADLLLVCLLQFYLLQTVTTSEQMKECFDGKEQDRLGNVTLKCQEGYVINMEDALLGRNKWGNCVIVDGDCMEKTRIFSSCDGQRICTKSYKTYSAQCGYSTIMILSYSCQPSLAALLVMSSSSTSSPPTTDALNIIQNKPRKSLVYTDVKKKAEAEKDFKETAIIIGCVIASVVTVIALVVAIILVVRRLLQKGATNNFPSTEGDKDRKETTCINLDVPCLKPGSPDLHGDREIKKAKRPVNKTSSFRTITGKTKTRMAPVGEESLTQQGILPSESIPPSSPSLSSSKIKSSDVIRNPINAHTSEGNTKQPITKRSRKRDAKNNNVVHKNNENINKPPKQNKLKKETEECVSSLINETVSHKASHKTDNAGSEAKASVSHC